MPEQLESCYDCESLNITYRFLRKEDGHSVYEAICHDCGSSLGEDIEDE